jgi:hypothetical protein
MDEQPITQEELARKEERHRCFIAQILDIGMAPVAEHFPDLVDRVKAALAVAALVCFLDVTQPTTLIFVGRSGAGKTLPLTFLTPPSLLDPLAKSYFYRSDDFTAASFVSHRADAKKSQLGSIDLLPRLKNKTLITPELAPFFHGKQDELLHKIARVTRILDGQGFISDSGAHGRRGYVQPINFCWLGATTPLSPEVLAIMAQLGPRLLFYGADRPAKDTDALIELTERHDGQNPIEACREAVQAFLTNFYLSYPPRSAESSTISIDRHALRLVALWAQVLVALRATIAKGEAAPEHAERVLGMLVALARGSALVHGRGAVADDDLAQVAHIALSSGVAGRGRVLRAVLLAGGSATTTEIVEQTGLSKPTVLHYMRELAAVRLATFTAGQGPAAAGVALVARFTELCAAPMLTVPSGAA